MDFAGGQVLFYGSSFINGHVGFGECIFGGGRIDFRSADTSEGLMELKFAADVTFRGAQFTGAEVLFNGARFSDGRVDFDHAAFTGGKVNFAEVQITGGEVDFSGVSDWSIPPVNLPSSGVGLKMPKQSAEPGIEVFISGHRELQSRACRPRCGRRVRVHRPGPRSGLTADDHPVQPGPSQRRRSNAPSNGLAADEPHRPGACGGKFVQANRRPFL
jgi:hypothetical protein